MAVKICFFSGNIARSGGTERVGALIANELCHRGYNIHILSLWKTGTPHFSINEKINVSFLLTSKEGILYRTYLYPIIKLRNFIKKNQINILIDIDTTLSVYSAYAIKGTKCKLISWEHFNYWRMLKEPGRIRAKKIVKKHADMLVVLTNEDLNEHINAMGFEHNRICRIYNPSPFPIQKDYTYNNHIFLSVGRLTSEKGYDYLLKSWNIFQRENKEWKLYIVGEGEERIKLENLCKELNLHNVVLTGFVEHVEKYYKEASCYVLSSRNEGFPMVILEAQAHGLPVIAFDCKTGPTEMIDNNSNGYLIDTENTEKLAEAMLLFTHQKEQSETMSKEAIRKISQLTIEKIGEQWEDLIKIILNIQN